MLKYAGLCSGLLFCLFFLSVSWSLWVQARACVRVNGRHIRQAFCQADDNSQLGQDWVLDTRQHHSTLSTQCGSAISSIIGDVSFRPSMTVRLLPETNITNWQHDQGEVAELRAIHLHFSSLHTDSDPV